MRKGRRGIGKGREGWKDKRREGVRRGKSGEGREEERVGRREGRKRYEE